MRRLMPARVRLRKLPWCVHLWRISLHRMIFSTSTRSCSFCDPLSACTLVPWELSYGYAPLVSRRDSKLGWFPSPLAYQFYHSNFCHKMTFAATELLHKWIVFWITAKCRKSLDTILDSKFSSYNDNKRQVMTAATDQRYR